MTAPAVSVAAIIEPMSPTGYGLPRRCGSTSAVRSPISGRKPSASGSADCVLVMMVSSTRAPSGPYATPESLVVA